MQLLSKARRIQQTLLASKAAADSHPQAGPVRPSARIHPGGQEAKIPGETHLLQVLVDGDVRHRSGRGL